VSSYRLEHDLSLRSSLQTDTSDIAISSSHLVLSPERLHNRVCETWIAQQQRLLCYWCHPAGRHAPVSQWHSSPRLNPTYSQTKLLLDRTRFQPPHPYRPGQNLTLRRRPAHARECSPKNNSSHILFSPSTAQDPPASVTARATRQQLHHALFPQPRKSSPCKLVLQVDR